MTAERLAEALEAWNTGDAERVLAYFAEHCSYHASFGPELLGRSYEDGTVSAKVCARSSSATRRGRFEDTTDLFEFDGDLIRTKNAFRKQPL